MFRKLLLASLLIPAIVPAATAKDWATYRGDAGRTGYTSEAIADPSGLRLIWRHEADHPPMPAWPRSERLLFDRACQVISLGDTLLYGSSADGIVYALDRNTGKTRWTFVTDGPVRFAPAAWRRRVFVASDDGCLYALDSDTGRLLWKRRGGPDHRSTLGNGQLISKWPARGGPVVADDVVYFAAGIWPTDGIFLYALDADSGEVLWVNEESGSRYMPQPHGGANAESGIAVQGYLATTDSRLLVPTGRAVPAVFERKDGSLKYFHLQKFGRQGGAGIMSAENTFFNGGACFDVTNGEKIATVGNGQLAATPDAVFRVTGKTLTKLRWTDAEKTDRRGQTVAARQLAEEWSLDGVPTATALIAAADSIVLGSDGRVVIVDVTARRIVWSADVSGQVYGLAFANGLLLASTDQGDIYCFGSEPASQQLAPSRPAPSPTFPEDERYATAAEEILRSTKMTRGYCLDFGCGDGSLALELAKRSQLKIFAVDDDPGLVAQARAKLAVAGLYGSRVTVHQRDLNATGYPQYFANLIVSQRSLDAEIPPPAAVEAGRLQRPFGGQMCIGKLGKLRVTARGALAGAGSWTHQYADAANTSDSDDRIVDGQLGMLWYRDIDFAVPQRHGRAPSPLMDQGILYHEGLDEIIAVDAYNGRELWRYRFPGILKAYDGDELMGVAGTGSNVCLHEGSVCVADGGRCVRLDAAEGTLRQEFRLPEDDTGRRGKWGFLACDGNTLFGTRANEEHVVTYRYVDRGGNMKQLLTESDKLFAWDVDTGTLLWQYEAKDSIRHNAIAICDGLVYLIDRPLAMFDREKKPKSKEHALGVLIALDAKTGRERWRATDGIFGTLLACSPEHKVLLMSYQPTRFRLDSERGGKMRAYDSKSGQPKWEISANYESRPLVIDRTIYAQGGAWDLLSGTPVPWDFRRSYGCGILAGSKKMLVYRSATLGYCSLGQHGQNHDFGGMRPGCWINAIPAGGLVLVPDATAGCGCSYLNRSWVALEPDPRRPPRFTPNGGTFRKSLTVELAADTETREVRYTLDGSSPDVTSRLYQGPLSVAADRVVKARAFYADGTASLTATGRFVVDSTAVPLSEEHWKVWDVSGDKVSSAPSKWTVVDHEVHQTSNILDGGASDTKSTTRRDGTLRMLRATTDFTDGEIALEVSSNDDDGLGLAFRAADPHHLYLLALDAQRKFRVLAVKDGDRYEVLDQNTGGYQPRQWHAIRVVLNGNQIRVFIDGRLDLQADDPTFKQGTIALYTWGCTGVKFRDIKIKERP